MLSAATGDGTGPSLAQRIRQFTRKTTRIRIQQGDAMDTNLRRCLSTFDVTLLSIGHMVGSGVYVLTPTVAMTAGPGIVISYLISGVASFLAALCYAELGVRYPRSGSAYSYTYMAIGELWAFLVGWNVALENTVGAAAVARSCSAYLDALAGGAIANTTSRWVGPIHSGFVKQLDLLSLAIVLVFATLLSFGARITSGLNNAFSLVNISVMVLLISVGAYFADLTHWTDPATGGFLPFGWNGVFSGAATCFYAYVGFDSIAAAAEEAKNPRRSIPLATMISMTFAAVMYTAVGAVLTLMVSYKDIRASSGIPDALGAHGATWARYVVIVGALCGMSTALIGSLFALTRVIYAMADDGLLFPLCARVNRRSQIPLGSMWIFGGIFAAILAFLLEVGVLAELLSIGTLFAYLVVSACVIVIRYRPAGVSSGVSATSSDCKQIPTGRESENIDAPTSNGQHRDCARSTDDVAASNEVAENEKQYLMTEDAAGRMRNYFTVIDKYFKRPPSELVNLCILLFVIFAFLLFIFLKVCQNNLSGHDWWAFIIVMLLVLGLLSCFVLIMMHQQSTAKLDYKVPLVPLFPALSILINAFLISNLALTTFMRLFVWIAIGLVIYFGYGIRHSKLNITESELGKSAGPMETGCSENYSKPDVEMLTIQREEGKLRVLV